MYKIVEFHRKLKTIISMFACPFGLKQVNPYYVPHITRLFSLLQQVNGKPHPEKEDINDIAELLMEKMKIIPLPTWLNHFIMNDMWVDVWDEWVSDLKSLPLVLENSSRNIFIAVDNTSETFELLTAYRDLMGKQKYSSDSGWKSARIFECGNLTMEAIHNAKSVDWLKQELSRICPFKLGLRLAA